MGEYLILALMSFIGELVVHTGSDLHTADPGRRVERTCQRKGNQDSFLVEQMSVSLVVAETRANVGGRMFSSIVWRL